VMTLGFFGIPPQFLYIMLCCYYYVHEENKICMYACKPIIANIQFLPTSITV
jgi:hypothetical protein